MATSFHNGVATTVIRRGARYLLITLIGTALVAVATVMWLLRTESGASWLWSRATAALPEQLSAVSVRGSVSGGLHIDQLQIRQPGTEIAIGQLLLAVNPDVFPLGVTVETLQACGIGHDRAGSPFGDAVAAPCGRSAVRHQQN